MEELSNALLILGESLVDETYHLADMNNTCENDETVEDGFVGIF